MNSETLYLVDGSGYIYRAFYAVQPLSNSKGLPTNALFGFSRMLTKLLRDVSARYIAVAFDMGEKTFRHEQYEAYKANRAECPAELVQQMPYFREIVRAYGIPVLEQAGVEADDIIGTLAKNRTEFPIVIVSGDKDLCQLVDERVVVWDAMRDIRYDREGVIAKFGVPPEQVIDFLALTGDSSDNVPGIAGIGPKTAAQLLNHFRSIDALLANLPEVESIKGLRGAKRVRESIESGKEKLLLSRELVTLKCDVSPFDRSPNEEELHWHGADLTKLQPLFQELEIKNPQLPTNGVSLTQGDLFAPSTKNENYRLATRESLEKLFQALEQAEEFGFDTETTSVDPFRAELVGISLSVGDEGGVFVPLGLNESVDLDLPALSGRLSKLLNDPTKRKIASNLKFDLSILKRAGLSVSAPIGDTMLASYVLNPDLRQHGLKELVRRYLGEEMRTFEEVVGKNGDIRAVAPEELAQYASHDADAVVRLHRELMKRFSAGARRVYEEIELPTLFVLEKMEEVGIRVDRTVLQEMSDAFQGEIAAIERELKELAGQEINLNSPKQLAHLLFEEFKLPTAGIKKTTHGFSTDASALERLSKHHPFPSKLLEYRELFKLKSTYLDALQALIRPETGRVHTSFNQAVAATGRLSSSEPNLQNIPIRNPKGRAIRRAFVAEKGWKLICADYSQVELRILAHLSGDAALTEAFQAGSDVHTLTAERVFGAEFRSASSERQKELRRYAKTINFGVIYGMGANRLAEELTISRSEAARFIDGYFATYSGVARYFEEIEERAKRDGYVETLFGRRRYIGDIDTSGRDSGYAIRSVLNAPIQGTAADIMKLAMIKLDQALNGKEARIVLQVHDELIIEAREDCAEEMRLLVEQEMSGAASLSVPLQVESRVADSWGA